MEVIRGKWNKVKTGLQVDKVAAINDENAKS